MAQPLSPAPPGGPGEQGQQPPPEEGEGEEGGEGGAAQAHRHHQLIRCSLNAPHAPPPPPRPARICLCGAVRGDRVVGSAVLPVTVPHPNCPDLLSELQLRVTSLEDDAAVGAVSGRVDELRQRLEALAASTSAAQARSAVSRSYACIGSPCLRHCVHGASIGGGGGGGGAEVAGA
jgi:hypothetical protein